MQTKKSNCGFSDLYFQFLMLANNPRIKDAKISNMKKTSRPYSRAELEYIPE